MKILLDECITKKLKQHLLDFEVFTVSEMGWLGITNGNLMTLSVKNNFDILLTIDKNLVFQQNVQNYAITVVVLNSSSSRLDKLIDFIPKLKEQVHYFKKNEAYIL